MTVKKIGLIGRGYVGKAMHNFFKDHYEVLVYDPQYEFSVTKEEINKCDLGVVCVPTPMADNKSCDLSIVEETLEWLETPLILIKSTVEVGTTDNLKEKTGKRIVFSPEFCGESTYWSPYLFDTDVKETPWFIFGGEKEDTTKLIDVYMKITGPTKVYRQTNARTAELTKYVENCFYATKVLYCYEIANICKLLDVDYNEMRDLWLLDPRINKMHTAVFDANKRPFGGKCFPKDLNAMVAFAEKFGYSANLLKEVLDSNDRIAKLRGEDENG